MKQAIFDHLPPLHVAAIWTAFGVASAMQVDAWWLVPLVTFGGMAFVQSMELLNERHEGWRINRKEIVTDVFYMVFMVTVISTLVGLSVDGPLGQVKEALGISTPWLMELPFLVQVVLVMLIWEFGQYWMHRFMHNNDVLWSTHAPHHHVTQLNALKGYIGNPIELFLISLSVLALLDFDINAIFAGLFSLSAIALYAHANIRSNPPAWFAFFFTTIRNHSLHHTALSYEDTRCNYGNSVILWDRVFGTFKEGESEVVGQDDRRRLSIKEQWLFPITFFQNKRREQEPAE
ncbi:MAG: sterol desaturase family protein [Pseudomonadota bacterium]